MRWMPYRPSFGAHNHRLRRQLVLAKSSSSNRRPASTTPTRYPFSTSRNALTLPPNPEPTIRTSKSVACSVDLSNPMPNTLTRIVT